MSAILTSWTWDYQSSKNIWSPGAKQTNSCCRAKIWRRPNDELQRCRFLSRRKRDSVCMSTNCHKPKTYWTGFGVYLQDARQRVISYADKYAGWCLPAFFLLQAQPYQPLETTGNAMVKEQISENKLPVRLILDLRALNKRIWRKSAASWPQESCRNILNRLRGTKILTSLDFNQAYWQMRLSEKCRRYTGHNLINLHFILNRAPLGLAISGTCWAAMLQKQLIENSLSSHVLAFVDDCLLSTKTANKHKEYLIRLVTTFKKSGWKLKLKKMLFLSE